MIIIFNSDDEVDIFIDQISNTRACPADTGLMNHPDCENQYGDEFCVECWRQSGIFEKKRIEV